MDSDVSGHPSHRSKDKKNINLCELLDPDRPCTVELFDPDRPCTVELFDPDRPCTVELFDPDRPCTVELYAYPDAGYPDRLGPSRKYVENSTKLTCLDITGYRMKYSTMLWLLEFQIRSGRKV